LSLSPPHQDKGRQWNPPDAYLVKRFSLVPRNIPVDNSATPLSKAKNGA
jgi:hypothetical protein